jgi:heat shock protein HslJ
MKMEESRVTKTLKNGTAVWMALVIPALICACVSRQVAEEPVPPSFDLVIGKEWKLVEVLVENVQTAFTRDALDAEFSNFYTLKFQDGAISGRAAPNNYRGPYELAENQGISFNKIAATLMAPLKEPENLKENEYFKYLEGVSRWDLRDGRLELHGKDQDGTASALVFAE